MKINLKNVEQLAQFVRAERKRQRVTQKQLSQLANVGVRFIRDLEAGKETVQLDKVMSVLDTMGIDIILSAVNGEE